VEIARRFLLPRQIERHGLKKGAVAITRPALILLMRRWTREAGVRVLEQQLAKICRKEATRAARGRARRVVVEPHELNEYLGVERYVDDAALKPDRPGVAIGLAWTPVGGEALSIEALMTPGSGRFTLTGKLGDVMLESARIALSHVQSQAKAYGADMPEAGRFDLHLHVPAGAVAKDGPSAGIAMATAFTSLYRRQPIRKRLAMTGELTLTGKVLPVGGLRDKVLAARREGLREVILPVANRREIRALKEENRAGITFHYVTDFSEVVELAFAPRRARRRKGRGAAGSNGAPAGDEE
jgi:ATP-dependent Lon protease